MALHRRLAGSVVLGMASGALLLASTQCAADPTELVVVVDTDLTAGKDIDSIEVTVSVPKGDAGQRAAEVTSADALPLTFGVQAGSDPNVAVRIVAVGKLRGDVAVRTTVTAQMLDGTRTLVHVSLCRSCIGQVCDRNAADGEWTGATPPAPRCDAPLGADGGDAGRVPTCPADMVLRTTVPGAGRPSYCIDRTEVTQRSYETFLGAVGGAKASDQPPECAFNTDYAGTSTSPNDRCLAPGFFNPKDAPDLPVACIDWCDARAYCAWNKKHLCGRIGDRTTLKFAESEKAATSEWFAACSNNNTTVYPWGGETDLSLRCNVAPVGADAGMMRPVESLAGCSTMTPNNIYDLIGNAFEWEDSCEPDAGVEYCVTRGGSFVFNDSERPYLRCSVVPPGEAENKGFRTLPRFWGRLDVGFRCCADPE